MGALLMNIRVLLLVAGLALLSVASPVFAENVAETVCIQCHGGQPGRLGEPVKEWPGSVHQKNGLSCHDCHGGDPTDFANAMNPQRGFVGVPAYDKVPEFCGRCHVGVLADYRESAHGRKVAEGGAQCVTCHSNHAVREASLELINEQSCSRCHDYARAATIREALAATDAAFASVGGEFERLKMLGVDVEGMKGRQFDLRNRFHRVFHNFEVEKVRAETAGVQSELAALGAKVDELDAQFARRRFWGGIAIGLLVLLGVVLLQVRHSYAEEEGRD